MKTKMIKIEEIENLINKDSIKNEIIKLIKQGHLKTYEVELK